MVVSYLPKVERTREREKLGYLRKNMNLNPENFKDLTKIHTKVLLDWLNHARKCGGSYSPSGTYVDVFSIDELKAELATREHIPNKEEAKKIRQQKAWSKRNR